jgi:hypothetical protein
MRGTFNDEIAVVVVEQPTDDFELALYRELSAAGITAAVRVCRFEERLLQLSVFQAAFTLNPTLSRAWTHILTHVVQRACASIGCSLDLLPEVEVEAS